MITFKVFRDSGFEVKGHAAAGAFPNDTVCAAVSSAVYLAANTITDSFGQPAEIEVDNGYMLFRLSRADEVALKVLRGLENHIRSLAEEFPRNIKVIYGG